MEQPTWTQSEVFPVIERLIRAEHRKHHRFVTEHEVARRMLEDRRAKRLVAAASERQKGWPQEQTAINMVAWFSAKTTVGTNPWGRAFELRTIDGRCAFRPVKPRLRKAEAEYWNGQRLHVVTNRAEVRSCQEKLQKKLKMLLEPRGRYTIGHQAGNFKAKVYANDELWFTTGKLVDRKNPCHWNCLGIELAQGRSSDIVVEINPPLSGIHPKLGGVFARDARTDDVFLLHRGRVGGGRKGVGKRAFMEWYHGEVVDIEEAHGSIGRAILITSLSSATFLDNLTYFVQRVAEFKALVAKGGEAAVQSGGAAIKDLSFTPEFSGTKKGNRPSDFIAECHHGRVVDALAEYLRRESGDTSLCLFNLKPIDLGIAKANKVVEIYEVKTNTSPQSLYTAIGQLLFHSAQCPVAPKTTLVVPVTRDEDERLVRTLDRLGIALMRYKTDGKRIEIMN